MHYERKLNTRHPCSSADSNVTIAPRSRRALRSDPIETSSFTSRAVSPSTPDPPAIDSVSCRTSTAPAPSKHFACPYLQYNLHHQNNTYPRCGAVRNSQMAEVRRHVKRAPHHAKEVKVCPSCKEHFKDPSGLQVHAPFGCEEPRLSIEDQWFSLFRALTDSDEAPRGPCKLYRPF